MVRPHHIIHASGVAALAAILASVVLVYTEPTSVVVAEASDVATSSTEALVEVVEAVNELPTASTTRESKLGWPISNALERVTKKTFGMEVHPHTSPVKNDRFDGYHVGVDFEVLPEEEEIDVPIRAICDGPLFHKQFAKGYGGYALQTCRLDGERVTVLYGHMDLESVRATSTRAIGRGETIGVLGHGYSPETDGVRKHLHLGIHRGSQIDIRGYVQSTSEINRWLDVLPYLKP